MTLGPSVKIHVPLVCAAALLGNAVPTVSFFKLPSPVTRPFRSLSPSASLSSTLQPHSLLDYLARYLERVEVNCDFLLVTERADSHRLRVFFAPTNHRPPNPTDRPDLPLARRPSARHLSVSEIDPSVATRISLLTPLGIIPSSFRLVAVRWLDQRNNKITKQTSPFPLHTHQGEHTLGEERRRQEWEERELEGRVNTEPVALLRLSSSRQDAEHSHQRPQPGELGQDGRPPGTGFCHFAERQCH